MIKTLFPYFFSLKKKEMKGKNFLANAFGSVQPFGIAPLVYFLFLKIKDSWQMLLVLFNSLALCLLYALFLKDVHVVSTNRIDHYSSQ